MIVKTQLGGLTLNSFHLSLPPDITSSSWLLMKLFPTELHLLIQCTNWATYARWWILSKIKSYSKKFLGPIFIKLTQRNLHRVNHVHQNNCILTTLKTFSWPLLKPHFFPPSEREWLHLSPYLNISALHRQIW